MDSRLWRDFYDSRESLCSCGQEWPEEDDGFDDPKEHAIRCHYRLAGDLMGRSLSVLLSIVRRTPPPPAPTVEERSGLRWKIERHLGGVDEWAPGHDLPRSTFDLLRECQAALRNPATAGPQPVSPEFRAAAEGVMERNEPLLSRLGRGAAPERRKPSLTLWPQDDHPVETAGPQLAECDCGGSRELDACHTRRPDLRSRSGLSCLGARAAGRRMMGRAQLWFTLGWFSATLLGPTVAEIANRAFWLPLFGIRW